MSLLCDVDSRAKLNPSTNPISIEGDRYDWLIVHIKDPDVIELLTLMRVRTPDERAEMLRGAAEEACLPECALADFYSGGEQALEVGLDSLDAGTD